MDVVRALSGITILSLIVAACSSGSGPDRNENIGVSSEAITAACSTETVGLPCDPDGPAGPLLECEGQCFIGQDGLVACNRLAVVGLANLDGVVCGNLAGVGDGACTRHCQGKTCLAQNASAGAACRPSAGSSPCDGQCDGGGKCTPIAQPCAFGRDQQLCQEKTCNFLNATSCTTQFLLTHTTCSDSSACQIGECYNGSCIAGAQKGCDDGNSCTDDTCDAQSGACVGTPNNANTCSDSNACTTGDSCVGGSCIPGNTPLNCDDSNACTADGCDPNTGCFHQQKDCSDGDACTQDLCDASSAQCSHPQVNCDDGDPCTTDGCNSQTGCTHTALNCADSDACTTDSCVAGSCVHTALNCADNDSCTVDSCDTNAGCVFRAIAGCGNGGSGSAGASGSATANGGGSGSTGTGGSAMAGGGATGSAGASGSSGANGGTGGAFAGAGGGGGNSAGSGGETGATDSSGFGGLGTSGSSSAGASVGGVNGVGGAGTAGVAGSTSSGALGQGADAGSHTIGLAGAADVPSSSSKDDGGCSCRQSSGGDFSASSPFAFAALLLAAGRRRRRVVRRIA